MNSGNTLSNSSENESWQTPALAMRWTAIVDLETQEEFPRTAPKTSSHTPYLPACTKLITIFMIAFLYLMSIILSPKMYALFSTDNQHDYSARIPIPVRAMDERVIVDEDYIHLSASG